MDAAAKDVNIAGGQTVSKDDAAYISYCKSGTNENNSDNQYTIATTLMQVLVE